ncbi:unnamed protein product [Urochloa decumbens]|uniref:KIB1-4 beta-propeller domain-containing protein n=1 Tax=Urochloa decumbens TaxID=240449 RepID=A0ABC9AVM1_9POAL
MEPAIGGGAAALPDWTQLPEEVLVTMMGELEILDLIRSGAVCTSWRSSFAAFRRLRLPSPRQAPCLLYSGRSGATALYCPSTGGTLRVPFRDLRGLSPIGSARGWLVVADEASDLHLANPLTGARVALPPITTLRCVEGGAADPDGGGGLVYRVRDERGVVAHIPAAEARDCVHDRAALSGSPLVAGGHCVVLLLNSPLGELSFARPGDERWTWVPPGGPPTGLPCGDFYRDAAYNDRDGLFYVVRSDDSIYALDLKGPNSPVVARRIMPELRHGDQPYRYLIHAPWGELLQAWRFRREYEPSSSTPVEIEDGDGDDVVADPSVELNTTELLLSKVDSCEQRLVKLDGLRDYALLLGYNGSMCLPVKDFPGLKPNSAYVMDDSTEFMNFYKNNKREIGVWDIDRQSLQSLSDSSPLPLKELWLNWPAPIWLTPSLL